MQKIETDISELLNRRTVDRTAYIQDLQKSLRLLLLEEVRDLEEMIALLQKKRFGSSSEATPVQGTAANGGRCPARSVG